MILASVVGRFFLGMYKKELHVVMRPNYLGLEEAMGAKVLEIAYIVLLISAVIALGIDIFDIYISKRERRSLES